MTVKIDPVKKYTLKEIAELGLIPSVKGYASVYNLVTNMIPSSANKLGFKKEIAQTTTGTSIKAIHDGQPWNKISGKIKVRGSEIIKFLQITKLT